MVVISQTYLKIEVLETTLDQEHSVHEASKQTTTLYASCKLFKIQYIIPCHEKQNV